MVLLLVLLLLLVQLQAVRPGHHLDELPHLTQFRYKVTAVPAGLGYLGCMKLNPKNEW
jgi:hypothetical protein